MIYLYFNVITFSIYIQNSTTLFNPYISKKVFDNRTYENTYSLF